MQLGVQHSVKHTAPILYTTLSLIGNIITHSINPDYMSLQAWRHGAVEKIHNELL